MDQSVTFCKRVYSRTLKRRRTRDSICLSTYSGKLAQIGSVGAVNSCYVLLTVNRNFQSSEA